MAINQASVTFAQETVKRIAAGVTEATIDKHWRDGRTLQYLSFIQAAGEDPPSENDILRHGRRMFENSDQEIIEELESADVYAYCNSPDTTSTESGRLVVTT